MEENKPDLSQQYQDILDRYSKELSSGSAEAEPTSPPPANINPVKDESIAQLAPPITPQSIPASSVSVSIDSLVTPAKKAHFDLFKYLFFLSLIMFLAVFGGIIYTTFLSKDISPDNSQLSSTTNPQNTLPAPTSATSNQPLCYVNDKSYSVGESFAATDGCNTCTCSSDLTISCTEKSCSDASAPTSSPSSKPKPTISLKTYKDSKYGYQFDCPSASKHQVEATSINGNKIPYKQESCTDKDGLYATVSVYDNTVVHSFGSAQTYISSDKKYIVVIEGDDPDQISSFKFF